MDKLIEFEIASALEVVFTILMAFLVYRRMKTTNLPLRYDRIFFVGGIFFVAFLMIEGTFGIYIYHLPWYYYIFVALFGLVASTAVTLITRRVYKRSHPNEPTNVKRQTFREALRTANDVNDPVNWIFAIAFALALIASQVFHQPNIFSFATPLVVGPWAIYNGRKMLWQAREEQQPDGIHWYTQYKILFGIATFFLLPYDLIERGPFTFIRAYPYTNILEHVFSCIAVIPFLVSGFFFFRRQYLKRRDHISPK